MTFKHFCYEKWLDYVEECLCYNIPTLSYKDWINNNKWYLRKRYRLCYDKLQSEWNPDYERILPRQESD